MTDTGRDSRPAANYFDEVMSRRHRGDDVTADDCVVTPADGASAADKMAAAFDRRRCDDSDDDYDVVPRRKYEVDMQLFERVSTSIRFLCQSLLSAQRCNYMANSAMMSSVICHLSSVTQVYCDKTTASRITRFSPQSRAKGSKLLAW